MRIFIFRQRSPLMFPGLMAVKFNLLALPVLEGDGQQGLLQTRCPPATMERRQGFSHHMPTRVMWEQGTVLPMSTAPSVPVCPWGVQASPESPGNSASLHPWDTQHPWTSLGHAASLHSWDTQHPWGTQHPQAIQRPSSLSCSPHGFFQTISKRRARLPPSSRN